MLTSARDPIIATATASGRGAVGIVRLSGLGLTPLAQALCGQPLQPRVATLTPFLDAEGQAIDTGLALFFPAPHSYTGEDVLELQAHGGPVLLQLLLARCLTLASEGLPQTHDTPHSSPLRHLRLARPGEFTERAYLNGKLDLAQAEAVADIIDASTEAAARSAQRSLAGAFSHEVTRLQEALTHLRMLVEATLDFPEEELDFLQQADAQGQLTRLRTQLAEVLARTQQGALLREGIRVVIAGQPNAGKSSLLNALAGAELAIVTPIAGTTRDVLRQTIQIEGVPLHVVDTAGLRQTDQAGVDAVEKIGIERAWTQIAEADAVLWVRDATRLQDAHSLSQDQALEQSFQSSKVPVLEIWNKCDLRPELTSSASAGAPGSTASAPIAISAQTGEGLQKLRRALLELAGWQPQSEGLYLARQRHVQALQAVAQHLGACEALLQSPAPALDVVAEELRLSQNALGEITGSMSSDDLLGVIFSRFCIGK